jgi:hypothetical protein
VWYLNGKSYNYLLGLKERIELMHLEQLSKEVMNLSLEERAELAQRLLVSLDEAPPT